MFHRGIGAIAVNLTPRQQIQTCVISGVLFLAMGFMATVSALVFSTSDISIPLRIIGLCFLVSGLSLIAICRCCLKKVDAEDGKGDVAMLSVESQQPASYPVQKLIEQHQAAYSSISFYME